ncbi:rhodanese-like domain-containing protein [Aggregicoccus sp. 17bor-14]|uniref:rhodanese-like domain-containing protein n=1 Tax=Myxococcaceae TaxID=31 RepID=UPI00129C6BF6|nr:MULTISPECIES: rhodanese-like domain-containing protein [Myxococcaceae]MBF5041898.1 rhodanese-like domain-containing protein [Simulacricoccus sp. 17bor-14]MRI87679.1 rhodanese-like domain-containing protein [Aggregicoccus sp. 17bor-14]
MQPLPRVLEHPAALPDEAHRHFAAKLSVETDVSDVAHALRHAPRGWVLVDARSPEAFAARHIPGAQSLPHRSLSAETTAHLNRDELVVVYCWSPACNAGTKAAARFGALGFRVKEMLGGLEYWVREGHATEGTHAAGAPLLDDSQLG